MIKTKNRYLTTKIAIHLATMAATGLLIPQISYSQADQQILPYMFQQFSSSGNNFILTKESRIIVNGNDGALIHSLQDPKGWIQKLRYTTGLELKIDIGGTAKRGDIVLSTNPNDALKEIEKNAVFEWKKEKKEISKNVHREGYSYQADKKNLVITSNNSLGIMRGLQNVNQLLLNDGKTPGEHRNLPTGEGVDYPLFQTRGIMIDVGRRFVSVKDLIGLMGEMSAAKLNTLHLHLSDNVDAENGPGGVNGYLRLYDDSMPDKFKVLKPKDSPSDGADRTYYTKEDIQTLVTVGERLGIEIVPEIDLPGHARVFTNAFPQWAYVSADPRATGKTVIDVNNPQAVTYVTDAVKEYASWFPTNKIHVGGDEAYGLPTRDLNKFLDNLRASLLDAGFGTEQIGAWNNWGENTLSISKEFTTYAWFPTPTQGLKDRKWIDVNVDRYFVPYHKPNEYNSEGISGEKVYQTVIDTLNKSGIAIGGQLALWNDWGERYKYGFDAMNAGIARAIPTLGFSFWKGPVKDKQGNIIPFEQLRAAIQSGIREYESFRLRERFPYFTGQQALDLLNDTASYRTFKFKPDAQVPELTIGLNEITDPIGYDPKDMEKASGGPVLFRNGMFIADLPGEGQRFQAGGTCRDLFIGTGGRQDSACNTDTWKNDIGVKNELSEIRLQQLAETKKTLQDRLITTSNINDIRQRLTACSGNTECINTIMIEDKVESLSNLIADDMWWYTARGSTTLLEIPIIIQRLEAVRINVNKPFIKLITDLENREKSLQIEDYVGGLVKRGAGTLILTGNNSFVGGVVLEGGNLIISKDKNLGAISGALTFDGGALVIEDSFDLAKTRPVTLDKKNGTIDTNGHNLTLAQNITGSGGLIKQGNGVLTLEGDSSYKGSTLVNKGLLRVNGVLASDVKVSSGGFLEGTGQIGGVSVERGAVVSPGSSVGTLKVNGNVNFAPGSLYKVEISQSGQSDVLKVNGDVTLRGGDVIVVTENNSNLLSMKEINSLDGKNFRILDVNGKITGQFNSVSPNYLFLGSKLSYDTQGVTLTTGRNDRAFASIAETGNERSIATAIDSLPKGHPVRESVLLSETTSQARNIFLHQTGQIHADVASTLLDGNRLIHDSITDRMRQQAGASVSSDIKTNGNRTWAKMLGSWGSTREKDGMSGYDNSTYGILFGADHKVSEWQLGAAAGYTRTSLNGQYSNNANSKNGYMSGYASRSFGALNLRTGGILGWHRINTDRPVNYDNQYSNNSAAYNARSERIFADIGYNLLSAPISIEPYVGLSYNHQVRERFKETGGSTALSAKRNELHTLVSETGLRTVLTWEASHNMTIALRAQAGWQHQFNSLERSAKLKFNAGDPFTINSPMASRDAMVLKAGIGIQTPKDLSISLDYSGLLSDSQQENNAGVNVNWRF